jgi:hypothetical protein
METFLFYVFWWTFAAFMAGMLFVVTRAQDNGNDFL